MKIWVYFMKTYDEVFNRFQEFKALTENQISGKIMAPRSDNGGEYTSNGFDFFCREAWIKEFIVSYNPQQNGVAERKNMCIVETAKSMVMT